MFTSIPKFAFYRGWATLSINRKQPKAIFWGRGATFRAPPRIFSWANVKKEGKRGGGEKWGHRKIKWQKYYFFSSIGISITGGGGGGRTWVGLKMFLSHEPPPPTWSLNTPLGTTRNCKWVWGRRAKQGLLPLPPYTLFPHGNAPGHGLPLTPLIQSLLQWC